MDKIKEKILFLADKLEAKILMMGKDFMRFKFKTDDELVYNQEINIPVCVISISGVVKKGDIYYPQINLQKYFYESN